MKFNVLWNCLLSILPYVNRQSSQMASQRSQILICIHGTKLLQSNQRSIDSLRGRRLQKFPYEIKNQMRITNYSFHVFRLGSNLLRLVNLLPSMATGVWPAKTGNDLQRMILRSSDTRAISGGGFFLIWCWNRWFVYMWNDIPGCTRPARPDRCKALATDTHSVSKLVMCLFGS